MQFQMQSSLRQQISDRETQHRHSHDKNSVEKSSRSSTQQKSESNLFSLQNSQDVHHITKQYQELIELNEQLTLRNEELAQELQHSQRYVRFNENIDSTNLRFTFDNEPQRDTKRDLKQSYSQSSFSQHSHEKKPPSVRTKAPPLKATGIHEIHF